MPAGSVSKAASKNSPVSLNNSPATKPKERNKGGRPSNASKEALLRDESQAFESIKAKWNYISHKLADEASKAARSAKKIDGRSLVALTTAAGIAYDKRWSKTTADTTEIAMPPALISAIAAKCASPSPNPLITKNESGNSGNMVQGKPFTEQEAAEAASEEGSPDPASEPASQDG